MTPQNTNEGILKRLYFYQITPVYSWMIFSTKFVITAMNRRVLQKLIFVQLLRKLLAMYCVQKFIAVST
jgi:hypothetical protein